MVDCFIKVLSIFFNGFSKNRGKCFRIFETVVEMVQFQYFFLSCVFTKKGETIGTRLMNYCIEDC